MLFAEQLIAAIRQEIEAEGWSLAVGVGIHRGFRGGGVDRLRYPARFYRDRPHRESGLRLCDRAQKWQILVSEPFYELLGSTTRAVFERTEPMEFKHVAQTVATYRHTVPVEGMADPVPLQPA